MTLYQLVYDKPPSKILDYIKGYSLVVSFDEVLRSHDEILNLVRKNLNKVKLRMMKYVDNKMREVTYEVESWFLLS